MFLVPSSNHSIRRVNTRIASAMRDHAHLILALVVLIAFALVMYRPAVTVKSRELNVVRAEGLGKGIYNFRDGSELAVEYRGSERGVTALRSGQATPAAVAVADLDDNGTPDLIAGYAANGIGLVTIQRGNPEAYAPRDESVYPRLQSGYNPEALLSQADAYEAPIAIEHLAVGNFDENAQKDVLIAAASGGLYLMKGDGRGNLANAEQVGVYGSISALATGEFAAADGRTDVAVGLTGVNGPVVEVFDGNGADKFSHSPSVVPLSSPATAIAFGGLDDDPFIDVAIAAGNEIVILHGSGRNRAVPVGDRIERIALGYQAKSVAIGSLVWDRAGKDELAVLAEDGTVHILARGTLDTRPYTDADRPNRGRLRPVVLQRNVDIESLTGWTAAKSESWSQTSEISTGTVDQQLFATAKVSSGETVDLIVGGNNHSLQLVRPLSGSEKNLGETASAGSDFTSVVLDAGSSVVDAAVMPRKLNGEGGLVFFSKESPDPTLIPNAVAATIDVDRTDDNAAASACTVALNDCSLRGAVTTANMNVDSTTIMIPAGTYTLTIAGTGGCDGNSVGDLDINQDTIITGAGSATTIIRQTASGTNGDRVMCLNVPLAELIDYQFSGVTITGGRDVNSGFGGGGIIGGEKNNTHQFTDVVISNNQVTGGNIGGGGIQITGGNLTFTNCTIGGTTAPNADRTVVTAANAESTSGGGLFFTPSAPGHTLSTGNLTITGTTFSRNTAASLSEGGGGADVAIVAFASPGGIGTGSATFTSNTQFNDNSANPANGGGLIVTSLQTTVSGASFTSNSAGATSGQGGGIYVGSASLLLDGSVNPIFFTDNTASVNGGSSISVNNTTTVSGTLVSIGGDVVVNAQGTWTNSTGSTLAPTNFLMFGGIFNGNNSTMNITGNLTMQPQGGGTTGVTFNANSSTINIAGNFSWTAGGTTPVGAFSAGTGTFNFNGAGAQSISGSGTTFNNLTVNKASNTLTLNANSPITGNLNIASGSLDLQGFSANRTSAGGTLSVANGTTLRIGGTGSLPSNFSTHSIGATSTIEFYGSNQTVPALNSSQSYGNLTINGTGTKTLSGAISIATQFTLGASTLDASVSNFAINIAGNWTNNGGTFNPRSGTVTFNGAGNAQTIGGTAGTQPFFNLTINKASNSTTVGGSTNTLNITGALTLTSGVFNAGTATSINVSGNWTNNTGSAASFVPGGSTVTFNSSATPQAINGTAPTQTFNNLTVTKTGQTLSTGGSTTQLDVNTLNITAGTLTAPATLNIGGDFTQATGTTFTPGSGTVTFNGAGAQAISGTLATKTFNNLIVNKSGNTLTGASSTTTLSLTGNVTLSAGAFSAGTITGINLAGNWTHNGGTFTPGSSVVTFNNTTAPQTIGGSVATQTFNSITVNKTGQTLSIGGSTTTLTLNGNFTNTAGTFDVGTATTINVAGNWTNNGTFTPGSGTVVFNGNNNTQTLSGGTAFNNVTINHTGTGNVTSSGSTFTVNGLLRIQVGTFIINSTVNNVQIDSGATLQSDGGTMNVNGNWTNNGTFNASTGTVVFGGSALQTIGGTQPTIFNNLTINNANGVNLGTSITTGGTLALTSGALSIGSNTLGINGDITVGMGGLVGGATSNISVGGSGAATTLPAVQNGLNTLTLNRANGLMLGASLDVNDLTLTNGPLSIGATTLGINGNISVGTGSLVGGATSNISIGGMGANTTLPGVTGGLNNLTVNRANGITLGASLDITGVLTLTSGVITTNANTLILGSSASVSRAAGHVFGGLQKIAVPMTFTFDVGKSSASDYTPVNLANATGGGDLTVRSVAGQQPTLVGSNFLQEYWTLTSQGTLTADLTFNYLQGDVVGDESIYRIIRVNGGTVATFNNACPGTPCVDINANTAKIDGVSFFSDWTVGETIPTAANGLVTGRITTSDGTPVEGAVIRLSGTQTRKTITDANGNYRFDNVETIGFYTVTPSRANFTFSPSNRSFNQLGESTEAVFSATSLAETVNPLETPEFFVRQQYVDLLAREPDEGGFNYWSDRILECGANTDCVAARRRQVAAAFFIEQEFQLTGAFIYGLYKGSLGRHPLYSEFSVDRTQIVVGSNLETTKQAYAQSFVMRSEFVNKYQAATNADSFVDALISQVLLTSGVNLSSQRLAAIERYKAGSSLVESRSLALRALTENAAFRQAEYNSAFVLTEYFGYLRRDPDIGGYNFWLDVVTNREPNNYQGLVCAFITSAEYQQRFGITINRTDRECGQ